MFDFGKHSDYMAMGYAAMGILLGGMVLWLYLRYRLLNREQQMIDQLEAEARDEREERALAAPDQTPDMPGMAMSKES
jgi:hypothetical protein